MRRLESIEKKSEIKRIWYLQEFDLITLRDLYIPIPESIKSVIEFGNFNNMNKFIRFSDDLSFDFIRSQNWMIDEIDYINMNLFELNLALKRIIEKSNELTKNMKLITNRDDLEDIRIELIILDNNYKSLMYLIDKKKEEISKKTRK